MSHETKGEISFILIIYFCIFHFNISYKYFYIVTFILFIIYFQNKSLFDFTANSYQTVYYDCYNCTL